MKTPKLHTIASRAGHAARFLIACVLACILSFNPCAVAQTSSDPNGGNPPPTGTETGCYNGYCPGHWCFYPVPCTCEERQKLVGLLFKNGVPCPPTFPNPVNVGSSSSQREVEDIAALAGVGEHRLHWSRYGQSRLILGARLFGDGHIWRHSYQWEMSSPSSGKVVIMDPYGSGYTYTLSGGVWTSLANNPNVLTQSGNDYWLQQEDGFRYHFQKLTAGGQTYYQCQNFTDTAGQSYNFTYDSSRNLVLVTEPGGRWLRVTYQAMPVNQDQWTALYTVPSTPTPNAWTEIPVTNTTPFRYLRYYSTDPDQPETYCNVAEVEFYAADGVTKLSGTRFGTGPAWNNSANTFGKATDGNPATYFDYAYKHFGFTGIDLGAGNAQAVGKVRFYPRPDTGTSTTYASRMAKGRFEGSNTAPVTETVISKVELGYGSGAGETVTRTVNYVYTTMADPVLPGATSLVLSSAAYDDGTAAAYSYFIKWPGQRPLLSGADDPRTRSGVTKVCYQYWNNYVIGALYAERSYNNNMPNGLILAKMEGVGANNYTNQGRKITYANGSYRIVQLAADHHITSDTDALGRTATFTYGSGGNGFLVSHTLTATSEPGLSRTTTYTRDTQGRLLSVTYPDGAVKSWTRDSLGLVLTATDENGRTTTFIRDASHRVTRITYPDTTFELFTYNAFGQVLDHTLRNGAVEHAAYGTRGLCTSLTDAAGKVTTFTYNAADLPVTATLVELGQTTTYGYNERGQLTKVTYADGTFATFAYDAYGNQTDTTDELGHTWTAAYDEFHRRISSTIPARNPGDTLPRTTVYAYDETGSNGGGDGCCGGGGSGSGQITSVQLPSGKTVSYTYDLAGQKLTETVGTGTADAATVTYQYDARGNVVRRYDGRTVGGSAVFWQYTYDRRNRLIAEVDPLGNPTSYTYDAAGNRLTLARPHNGGTGLTTWNYDVMNRPVSETDALSQSTQFAYDAMGNLAVLTDARLKVSTFAYDAMSRRTSRTYPGGSHEDWTYDAAGNVTTYRNRAGNTDTLAYDLRNRPVSSAWDDGVTPAVTRSYDAAGRLLTLGSSTGALGYTYDNANELLTETQDLNAPTDLPPKTVTYSYDADGNRAGVTYPGGSVVGYTYTGRNQLKTISADGPPPLATYTYDVAGNRVSKVLENGTSATYTYDAAARLLAVDHKKGTASFQRFDYALDEAGNRRSRQESVTGLPAVTDAYGYDPIDEVTQVKYASNAGAGTTARQVDYAYDATGNRTTVTEDADGTGPNPAVPVPYVANDLNQYTTIDGLAAPTYDANGNLTRLQPPSAIGGSPAPVWTYTYDAQNRLTGGSSSAGDSFSFTYDARNRCVARTINGTTTCQIYDGWSVIEDRDSTDTLLARHYHGAAMDEILATVKPAGTFFHHHDGLGSVTTLTDASGNLAERVTYDIYGAPIFTDAANQPAAASPTGNRFLFTGREWLPSLRLADHRNRYYQPDIGRWLTTDPIREEGGVNLYEYVLNNPIGELDLLGLSEADVERIHNAFDEQIKKMDDAGEREGWGPRSGGRQLTRDITGNKNHPDTSCGGQAINLQKHIDIQIRQKRLKLDDKWATDFKNSTAHCWIEMKSSNPKDPVLRLDPFWNSFKRLAPSSR